MNFLIDIENVANSGFEGLENLSAEDDLLIFYSEKHSSINLSVHQKLEQSPARKEYLSIKTGGKNALDFQLVTWLGYRLAKTPLESYVIVSKDTGFDAVVDFWKKRGMDVRRNADLQVPRKKSEKKPEKKTENKSEKKAEKKAEKEKKKAQKKAKQQQKQESEKEKRIREMRKQIPEYAGDAAEIIHILGNTSTKQGLNNGLVKAFGSDKAGVLYKKLKPMIKNRKGK